MLAVFLAALETGRDRENFSRLYERYHTRMEAAAWRILKNPRDAEDAVQNAFVQVIRHFEKIDEIPCEEIGFWLISIVKNEARMILRKKSRTRPLEDWDGYVENAESTADYAALVALFARLPETYRAVLEMKYLLGCTDREIAQRLGISETAVSTRANRGRALLRRIVEKEGFQR